MKYLDEYRDPEIVKGISRKIQTVTTRPHVLMEICGGQTHAIVKYGIDRLLPDTIQLIHGPGCPVCVTSMEKIDMALHLAKRKDIIFCSFGDMLRVPGSQEDLLSIKAKGGDVRVVYSPLDALKIARNNPGKEIVFFAIGFETTAPANAWTVFWARKDHIHNFSLLVSHMLVPPAVESILSASENRVEGFLAAGHVCTVMGYHEYLPIAETYQVPIVVTGFEPVDLLRGIYRCVHLLEQNQITVVNEYQRSVKKNGNTKAQEIVRDVFRVVDQKWRGIGEISNSGLILRDAYQDFDAEKKFDLSPAPIKENSECLSGLILQGRITPLECRAFGIKCTPQHPLGPTMVSSEGACAAYYKYKKGTHESHK
jgi:hydrogenase expression/formation protein HypD